MHVLIYVEFVDYQPFLPERWKIKHQASNLGKKSQYLRNDNRALAEGLARRSASR